MSSCHLYAINNDIITCFQRPSDSKFYLGADLDFLRIPSAGLPCCSFPEFQSYLFSLLAYLLTQNFPHIPVLSRTSDRRYVLSILRAESYSEHYFHTGSNCLPFNFKSTFWPSRTCLNLSATKNTVCYHPFTAFITVQS